MFNWLEFYEGWPSAKLIQIKQIGLQPIYILKKSAMNLRWKVKLKKKKKNSNKVPHGIFARSTT